MNPVTTRFYNGPVVFAHYLTQYREVLTHQLVGDGIPDVCKKFRRIDQVGKYERNITDRYFISRAKYLAHCTVSAARSRLIGGSSSST